jgi:dephospho-CoA kinase
VNRVRPFVIGVTGGIGSGKTTVCREFEIFGVPVIDTDQVARDVVAPGTPGLAAVVAAFGEEVLGCDGQLDRRRLRQLVFAAPALRLQLEKILHPLIRQETDARIASAGYPYCMVCIPLLVERGGGNRVDRVLVIDVPASVQVERVMRRDELTAPEVDAIMRSQASREDRLAAAHDVLENSGDIAELRPRIAALHARYLQLADEVQA